MKSKLLVATILCIAVLGIGTANAVPTLDSMKLTKPKTTKVQKAPEERKITTPSPTVYIVQSGDTLYSLSEAHTTTLERVWAKNPTLTHPDVLLPGQTLIIPQNDEKLPERPLPTPVETPILTNTSAPEVIGGCGDNEYSQYIYQKESGCNLNATNAGGCRGIGQACPGSKLPCGADYACQNAFFTTYANSAYGGWAGAYSAWQRQGWW